MPVLSGMSTGRLLRLGKRTSGTPSSRHGECPPDREVLPGFSPSLPASCGGRFWVLRCLRLCRLHSLLVQLSEELPPAWR